jgi:hypothetical protein
VLVRDALTNLEFAELEQLRQMPGAVKAVSTSLMKVWDADLDLQALAAQSPRISDLAHIEGYVRDHLPVGMMLQRELVSAAILNLKNAGLVLGSVTVRGFVIVAPCWRRLFRALAQSTSIEWHSIETVKEQLTWTRGFAIRAVVRPTQRPTQKSVSASIRQVMHCDIVGVWLPDVERVHLLQVAMDFPESKGFAKEDAVQPIEGSVIGAVFKAGKPVVLDLSREQLASPVRVALYP